MLLSGEHQVCWEMCQSEGVSDKKSILKQTSGDISDLMKFTWKHELEKKGLPFSPEACNEENAPANQPRIE